ncbi:Olfactory receptor 867 [Heterocephalus glaber]|uniref:Olfactory receptor 867 n=1 Tax=Heterocephalus glaber TaxID=10181 RepID=G5AP71_HETGA|nr:Olfactory receptor 867 [Heterocephalus glaber]
MHAENHTGLSQFLLMGLSEDPEVQSILFGFFLSMYLVTVLGNLLIVLTATYDSHLYSPMYFFLCNLSFVDIGFISTAGPTMLVNIQAQKKDISYTECLTQVYLFIIFSGMDNFLLIVMAYDCFIAICYPLKYTLIMSSQFCGPLVNIYWLIIICVSLIHILLMMKLNFSISTEIPHFFCKLAQVLKVANSETFIDKVFLYVAIVLIVVFPVCGILFSYFQIVSSLMRISSTTSMYKAFSTCLSHLYVGSLFYGTGLGVYFSSKVIHFSQEKAVASVMYTVVTPMLNPFI